LTLIGAKFAAWTRNPWARSTLCTRPDCTRPDCTRPDCMGGLTMTKIQIELPDATAKAARDAGLLTSQALDRLLTEAIKRRQAADALLSIADRVAEAGIEQMPMEEIDAEVKAVRAERRRRAGGH